MSFKQNLLNNKILLNNKSSKNNTIQIIKFLNFNSLLPDIIKQSRSYNKSYFNFSNYVTTLGLNTKFNSKFCISSFQYFFDTKSITELTKQQRFFQYKLLKHKYSLNNKIYNLDCLILKSKPKVKKIHKFMNFFFKKKIHNKTNLSIFSFNGKSKNLFLNKYTPKKLDDVFISLKTMFDLKKLNIKELDDLDYRIYGLGKQLENRRINYRAKKIRISKLEPNRILY